MSVSLTILGKLVSMKNRRRQLKNRRTGKMFSAKSNEAVNYATDFVNQVPASCRKRLGGPKTPLRAVVTVFYPTLKSDLDCALIYDCLEAAGVIANDRYIRQKVEYAEIDRKNPRTEIIVEELT